MPGRHDATRPSRTLPQDAISDLSSAILLDSYTGQTITTLANRKERAMSEWANSNGSSTGRFFDGNVIRDMNGKDIAFMDGNVIRQIGGRPSGFIHDGIVHDNGGRITGFIR